MCVPTTARRSSHCRVVDDPDSAVAAWAMVAPDGTPFLEINAALLEMPGAEHYAEAWYRLNILTRGRAFAVLTMEEVAERAHLLAGHQHIAAG